MFKVGDRVTCRGQDDFGEVIKDDVVDTYSIWVQWENKFVTAHTHDGRYFIDAQHKYDLIHAPSPDRALCPFNLTEAKAGRPVMFRKARKDVDRVEFVSTLLNFTGKEYAAVFKVTTKDGYQYILQRLIDSLCAKSDPDNDIVMAPIKTTWHGVYWAFQGDRSFRSTTNLYKNKADLDHLVKANNREDQAIYFTVEVEE